MQATPGRSAHAVSCHRRLSWSSRSRAGSAARTGSGPDRRIPRTAAALAGLGRPLPRARLLSLCLRLRECRCERRADGLTSRRHADLADDVASLLFAGAGMPLLQPGPDDGPQRAHAQASLHLGADFRDAAAKGIFQIADGVNREDQRMVAQSDFATMRVRHQPPLPPSAQVSAPDFLTVKLRLILSSTGAFHETLVAMASTCSLTLSAIVPLCSGVGRLVFFLATGCCLLSLSDLSGATVLPAPSISPRII